MTQTRKGALQELLAMVDAGGKIQPFLFQDAFNNQNHANCAGEAYDAFDGSLDAALAMHNAVLPGWISNITQLENRWWIAQVVHPQGDGWPKWTPYPSWDHADQNPARAWLCAILKALIAECDR